MEDPGRSASGKLGEYAYVSRVEGSLGRDRSLAEVVKDIIADVQNMIRSELRLAKAEVREDVSKLGAAAGLFAVGAVLALYGVGFVLMSIYHGLDAFLPDWAAALVTGLLLCGAAALALSAGRNRIKNVNPLPERTIENVKENVEWMKNQTRS